MYRRQRIEQFEPVPNAYFDTPEVDHTSVFLLEENKYSKTTRKSTRFLKFPSKKTLISLVVMVMFLYLVQRTIRGILSSNELPKNIIYHAPLNVTAYFKGFFEWAQKEGVFLSNDVRIRWYGPDVGIGLTAIADLKLDDRVLTIPKKMIFSSSNENLVSKDLLGYIKQELEIVDDFTITAMALVIEKKNPTSFWKPYLDTLRIPNSPFYWTEAELDGLQNPLIKASNSSHITKYLREWVVIRDFLLRSDFKETISTIDNSEIVWGLNILSERSLKINGKTILAPYIDFINSALQWNSETKRYNDINKITFDSSGNLIHSVNANYKQNDQLLISYSLNAGTPEYFFKYGFVTENNMNDFITIRSKAIDDSEMRKQILSELNDMDTYHISANEIGLSSSFLRSVYISMARESELAKFDGDLTPDQERLAKVWVINNIMRLVKSWPTTLEEDLKILNAKKSAKLSPNEKAILKFRVEAKKLVIKIVNTLSKNRNIEVPSDTRKTMRIPMFDITIESRAVKSKAAKKNDVLEASA